MAFFRFGEEERAKFYELILGQAGRLAPIMLIDAKGNFVFASDAFLADLSLMPDELYYKSAYDLVENRYYDRSPTLKALAEGKDCGELSYSRGGFPVYTETKIIRDEQGEIAYVLCHSMKPANIDREVEMLRRQIAFYQEELSELKNKLESESSVIYQSQAMRQTITAVERVAKTTVAVMLTGESGVGKDLLARRIHDCSDRVAKPFVPICIPMISPSLLESELFGYVEGAFTGSVKKGKKGLFEAADGGTVFLDEVGDIPLELQVKLLRTLENQEIIPVGSTERKQLDIRIISATNRDIRAMIAQGLFREDLYYRLGVIHLQIPPLREREGDVPLLVEYFLGRLNQKYGTRKEFAPDALQAMEGFDWPGNVRQLRNMIEQAVVLSDSQSITFPEIDRLIQFLRDRPTEQPSPPSARSPVTGVLEEVQQLERRRILDALVQTNGNKVKAAQLLHMSRSKFYRRLRALEKQ